MTVKRIQRAFRTENTHVDMTFHCKVVYTAKVHNELHVNENPLGNVVTTCYKTISITYTLFSLIACMQTRYKFAIASLWMIYWLENKSAYICMPD